MLKIERTELHKEKDIENIVFSRFVKQDIPFEFISIKELYRRCGESEYDLSNPHRIEFHALLIVTEGESFHMIDFKREVLSPGTILPLTRDQVHAFNKDLTIKGFIISFEENFITQGISEQSLFHFLHIFHTPSILIGKENMDAIAPFLNLLERLHLDENSTMKSEIINSIFMSLLFQIKRFSVYQHKTFESGRFKHFLQFKQMITKNYSESHNVKDYAEKLSVSYKYLNDISKQIGHSTAKAFLDGWLILEAKRNILENKHTMKEIAYKMGFNEPSNFIRFFKKFTHVTPIQFQQNLTKDKLG